MSADLDVRHLVKNVPGMEAGKGDVYEQCTGETRICYDRHSPVQIGAVATNKH